MIHRVVKIDVKGRLPRWNHGGSLLLSEWELSCRLCLCIYKSPSHNASMHTSAYRWWPSPTYIIIFWWFLAMMYRKQCTSVDSLVWKVNTSTRQSESPFVVRHHDRKLTHRTYRAASWIVNRCVKDTKRDKFQMIILIFSNLFKKHMVCASKR